MQIISKDKVERDNSGRTNSIGIILCARRISECVKREYIRRLRNEESRICISRRIFAGVQEGVWRKR